MRSSAALLMFIFAAASRAQDTVSFQKQIRPILQRNCEGCHQPASRQSGLSLVDYRSFHEGGRKGAPFVAGSPEKSVIISYLTGETKPQMPFGGKPLPDDQIELVRRWIREGAKDDSPPDSTDSVAAGPVVYHAPPVITALASAPDGQTIAVSG